MTPEEAKQLIISTGDDFVMGSAIAQLAQNTPGVIYRSQSKLDSSVRMLPSMSEDEKDMLRISVTSMLQLQHSTALHRELKDFETFASALIGEDEEKMASVTHARISIVNLEERVQEAVDVLHGVEPEALRKILAEIVDHTLYVEVLSSEPYGNPKMSYIMNSVQNHIPKNATIKLGGLVFTPDKPAVGVLVSTKVYRQEALPETAFSSAEEVFDSFSDAFMYSRAKSVIDDKKTDSMLMEIKLRGVADDLNFDETRQGIEAVMSGIITAYERGDDLMDSAYDALYATDLVRSLDDFIVNVLDVVMAADEPTLARDAVLHEIEKGNAEVLEPFYRAIEQSVLDPSSQDALDEMTFEAVKSFALTEAPTGGVLQEIFARHDRAAWEKLSETHNMEEEAQELAFALQTVFDYVVLRNEHHGPGME